MPHAYHDIAFTPAVLARQKARGSRDHYAASDAESEFISNDHLTDPETQFMVARDSVYIASVGANGWPYIQHRGGPTGFFKVLDTNTIGWAEFIGNRQYITTGNLDGDERVSLFLMDYANKRRLKLFGHAKAIGADDQRVATLKDPGYRGHVVGGMIVKLEGFEWNCPQHIAERFSRGEVEGALTALGARVAELEAELTSIMRQGGGI